VTVRIFQVDAFTDKPFAGNPAAVCILPAARDEIWMQNVAREMISQPTKPLSGVASWVFESLATACI
jgi:predicted PhzF superfamily epimerase YddE/YHI9